MGTIERSERGGLSEWRETAAVLLLAIATVSSAWAGYQAARWSGVQATAFSEASAARQESARASTRAGQLASIDVATFLEWSSAVQAGDQQHATFLFERFRAPLKVATTDWLATNPLTNQDAPSSPFAMTEYHLPETDEANELEAKAEQHFEEAKDANQTSDNYILAVVLFASTLFFAGISSRFGGAQIDTILLGIGYFVLVGTAVWVITFPVTVSL